MPEIRRYFIDDYPEEPVSDESGQKLYKWLRLMNRTYAAPRGVHRVASGYGHNAYSVQHANMSTNISMAEYSNHFSVSVIFFDESDDLPGLQHRYFLNYRRNCDDALFVSGKHRIDPIFTVLNAAPFLGNSPTNEGLFETAVSQLTSVGETDMTRILGRLTFEQD